MLLCIRTLCSLCICTYICDFNSMMAALKTSNNFLAQNPFQLDVCFLFVHAYKSRNYNVFFFTLSLSPASLPRRLHVVTRMRFFAAENVRAKGIIKHTYANKKQNVSNSLWKYIAYESFVSIWNHPFSTFIRCTLHISIIPVICEAHSKIRK